MKALEEHFRTERVRYEKRAYKHIKKDTWFRAEDIVQEAYLRATYYYNGYNPKMKSLDAWFNTIFNNVVRDFLSKDKGQAVSAEEATIYLTSAPEAGAVDVHEDVLKKMDEVKKPLHREIITLHFIGGMSPRNISRSMEVSNDMVRAVLSRFRKAMK